MHEITRSICNTLMHHVPNQPSVAACAGDGTCSSHALRWTAKNLGLTEDLSPFHAHVLVLKNWSPFLLD